MALSDKLVSRFAKAMNKQKPLGNERVCGTIVVQGDTKYVRLDGSELLTPIATLTSMKDGDRVYVEIKNHTATVVGNITSPSANQDDVTDINNKINQQNNDITQINNDITQINNDITQIGDTVNSQGNTIERLDSEITTINSELTTVNSKVETIESDISTVESEIDVAQSDLELVKSNVDIAESNISALQSDMELVKSNVDIMESDLEIVKSDVDIFNSSFKIENDVVTGIKGIDTEWITTEDLEAMRGKIQSLDTEYANIDFTNIGKAAMEYFYAHSGLIENVVVGDQTITGELVGVTIRGDRLIGNTVIADKLVIKGSDGLYYKLNTDGMTVEAEQTDENSLNGQIIRAKSITATKIDVKDLVAFGATIGGFNITDNSIYSGVKESVDNTTRGIYMDDDGQIAIGDAYNYIKFFKDKDGSYKLHMGLSSSLIEFTDSGKTMSEALADTIVDQQIQFYQSTSPIALIGGSWINTQPTWKEGTYIWERTRVIYGDGTGNYLPNQNGVCVTGNTGGQGEKGDRGDTGPQGPKGDTGSAGRGVKSSAITYQASTSGTTAPTGTWSGSIPSVPAGQYLWTRNIITYSDNTTTTLYSVSKMGNTGATGAKGDKGDTGATGPQGPAGSAGKGISTITEYYLASASSSGVTTSTSGWTTTIQTISTSKKYLWNYEVTKYTDGSSTTSSPVIIGVYGDKGATGSTGAAGKGIKSITNYYLVTSASSGVTTSTSGWSTTPGTTTVTNKYLWNYEKITYTDNSTSSTTPHIIGTHGATGSKGDTGATGPQGPQGSKGDKGDTGATGNGVKSSTTTYQSSTSGTTVPTGTWSGSIPSVPAGQYLWTRTVYSYTNGSTAIAYSVSKMGNTGAQGPKGDKGDTGSAGKGVKSVSHTYQAGASATVIPTGAWSSAVVKTTPELPYLWTRRIETYTDNTTSAPSYSVSSSMDSLDLGGRNLFFDSGKLESRMFSALGTFAYTAREDAEVISGNCMECKCTNVGSYQNIGPYFIGGNYISRLKVGDNVTVSVWAKGNRAMTVLYGIEFASVTKQISITTEWQRFIISGVVKRVGNSQVATIFYSSEMKVGDILYLSSPKVEKGNIATDWTPAPEDVDAAVEEAGKTATNYIHEDSSGISVAQYKDGADLGNNVHIDQDSVDIRNGTNVLASFEANKIHLGPGNTDSKIYMSGDNVIMKEDVDTHFRMRSKNGIVLSAPFFGASVGPPPIEGDSEEFEDDFGMNVIGESKISLYSTVDPSGNNAAPFLSLETINDQFAEYTAIMTYGSNVEFESRLNGSNARFVLTQGNTINMRASSQIQLDSNNIRCLGNVNTTGEFVSTSSNALRAIYGSYACMFRNDGSDTYFLLTNAGDQYGAWNSLRPFRINNSSGYVYIGNGLQVTGNLTQNGNITLNSPDYAILKSPLSTSWQNGHKGTGAIIRQTGCNGWNPWLYVRGAAGSWTQGVYLNDGYYRLTYASDSTINSKNNTDWEWQFRPDGTFCSKGLIMTAGEYMCQRGYEWRFGAGAGTGDGSKFGFYCNGVHMYITSSETVINRVKSNNGLVVNNAAVELYGNTPFIDFHYNNSSADYTSRLIADQSNTLTVAISNKYLYTFAPLSFRPYADGGAHCGYPSYRWGRVYATNSAIGTSDENEKNILGEFDERYERFFMKLKPILYMWKNFGNEETPHDRVHFGLGAQTTLKMARECGLDEMSVAAICRDDLENPTVDGRWERYGLAYEELIPLTIHETQKALREIDSLKSQNNLLKAQLNALNQGLLKALAEIEKLKRIYA